MILAWPQAALDYYPYIDKRYKSARGIIPSHAGPEHLDILRRGIDTRMDVYKLSFVIAQGVALVFLTFCVLRRYRKLQLRYNAHVRLRILKLNLLRKKEKSNGQKPIELSFNEWEQESLGLKKVIE